MENVLKFPNSLWQASYTIQHRGGRLPSTSLASQKHQQAIFQSIEFGLAGHQDSERNNWIFQTMRVRKTWAKSKTRMFVRHQWIMLISLLAGSDGALWASSPSSAWGGAGEGGGKEEALWTSIASLGCMVNKWWSINYQSTQTQSFHYSYSTRIYCESNMCQGHSGSQGIRWTEQEKTTASMQTVIREIRNQMIPDGSKCHRGKHTGYATDVLFCWSCCNKEPHIGWLQWQICCLTVMGTISLKSRHQQGCLLLRAVITSEICTRLLSVTCRWLFS